MKDITTGIKKRPYLKYNGNLNCLISNRTRILSWIEEAPRATWGPTPVNYLLKKKLFWFPFQMRFLIYLGTHTPSSVDVNKSLKLHTSEPSSERVLCWFCNQKKTYDVNTTLGKNPSSRHKSRPSQVIMGGASDSELMANAYSVGLKIGDCVWEKNKRKRRSNGIPILQTLEPCNTTDRISSPP